MSLPPTSPPSAPGTVLLVLVATLAGCLYLIALTLGLFWLKLATKPVLVLALAMAVWTRAAPRCGRLVALGLVSGAIGDVCLVLPGAFLPGMIAFAIGHGLYVAAFLRWERAPALPLLGPVLLFSATGLYLMLPGAGPLAIPLAIYVFVISAMIWRAAACAQRPDDDALARWAPLAGAILFAFSDFLIGINRFHLPLPGAASAIIVTYWAAQTFFAVAAIRRKR